MILYKRKEALAMARKKKTEVETSENFKVFYKVKRFEKDGSLTIITGYKKEKSNDKK